MENFMDFFGELASDWGVETFLALAIILVGLAILIASIVCGVLRLIIFWNYWIARRKTESGITGARAAEKLLDHLGIEDVTVKKEGFFRALFYNNHYNPTKKIIYLRRTTFNGTTITAVALAAQKVALAMQDRQDGGKLKSRWRLQKLAIFGPVFFIPLVVLGLVFDFFFGFTGIPTLVGSLVGLAFFLCSIVLAGLTVSVEKRGARDAKQLLAETDLLTPEEQVKANKVLKTYILSYITDFIIAILKAVQFILKILLQLFTSSKNKN